MSLPVVTRFRAKAEIQAAYRLVDLSSRARAIVVENSGHHIQLDAPAAVVDAIRDVLDALRKESESER